MPEPTPMPAIDAAAILSRLRRVLADFLPDTLGHSVDSLMVPQGLSAGEAVQRPPGQTGPSRGVVLEGLLALSAPDGAGARRTLRLLGPGAPFGFAPGPGDAGERVVALRPGRVAVFANDPLTNLIGAAPALSEVLAAFDRELLHAEQDRVLMLGARKIASRLAVLVLQQWRQGQPGRLIVELPLPRFELAGCLGARVETLSRAITELRDAGCLRFHDGGRVEILSMSRLSEAAGQDIPARGPLDWLG